MLGEDTLGALANGAGPSGAGGGPGNQLQAQQAQQAQPQGSQEQEVVQQNTKPATAPSRYESQKRRDWNTFGQYLKNHRPPLALARCTGNHVLDFLRYLDQFGKTKVHLPSCHFFGLPNPPHPCPCPLRQAWGSLDALIGRLRAAFEENGGKPESNPFGARVVRLYLREVREMQAKARGIAYEKKKRKRPHPAGASASSNEQLQAMPQASPQANPLAGHGYAHNQQSQQQAHLSHQQLPHHAQQQHPHHSAQHSPHARQHPQHSQHSPHAQQQQQPQQQTHHSHGSPVAHPHSAYPPSSNPLSPFSQQQQPQQQTHPSNVNLLHNYAPNTSGGNTLNPYSQPNTLNGYQELQLHNHTPGLPIS